MSAPSQKLLCLIGQLGNGGTERQMCLFLEYLDKTRWAPTVVVSSAADGVWRPRLADMNIPVVSLDGGSAIVKMFKFNRLVAELKPSVIFSWSHFTNGFKLAVSGVGFIGSFRQEVAGAAGALGALRMKMALTPPSIVVNSNFIAGELRARGVRAERIHTVFNMFLRLPADEVRPKTDIRRELGIDEDAVLVAGVGRDSPTKDFPFFVNAFAAAAKRQPRLRALLVGSGGTAVKALIDELGLTDAFTITGEVPDARLLMPAADIFFLSSRHEGLANVLIEAVDAGCACVATDVGGVRDTLVDGESGFIIASGDVNAAAAKIVELAGDAHLRRQFAAMGRRGLDRFSPETAMENYLRLIENR